MEKRQVDRRVEQMEAEGVTFITTSTWASRFRLGARYSHDAVILSGGAEKPRDLPIPGRDLAGIHFAMDFLPQQNRRVSNEGVVSRANPRDGQACGRHRWRRHGSDCIGTSVRQGALSVTQLEIMPQPPERRTRP